MQNIKIDIRDLTREQLTKFFVENKKPKFRAIQVYEWLWKYRVLDFSKMTNLSKHDRSLLENNFQINGIQVLKQSFSKDGTVKFLFEIDKNRVVEGVLIPQLNRYTVCISSQVGCSLACTFCATGKLKLYRNLTAAEIYDQVFLINKFCLTQFQSKITNIVYMGMGEPLLNIKNVLLSISHITSKSGLYMSSKRITVSTAGISKMIRKIADLAPKFNLAISLHSANNIKRTEIMEINKSNDLESLSSALQYFFQKTKIKPTYEYVLLKGFNDTAQDAHDLISFCKKIPSKVNLIEYNKVDDISYEKSTTKATTLFISILEKNKILVKFRKSRGEDIGAACGQLATELNK